MEIDNICDLTSTTMHEWENAYGWGPMSGGWQT